MKHEHLNYARVGGFVLLMLSLLTYVLVRVTGKQRELDLYYVNLTNVTGIELGSKVTFDGFRIGQIELIEPKRVAGRTHYKVHLGITSGWRIPADSFARIDAPSLLAEFLLNITEGKSARLLNPGATIEGKNSVNIMSAISLISAEFNELSSHSIAPLLENINQQFAMLGPEIVNTIPVVLNNVNQVMKNLNTITQSVQSLFSDKNQHHLDNIFQNTDHLSAQLLRLSGQFKDTGKQLKSLLSHTNGLVTANKKDIRHTVSEFRSAVDTLSQNIHSIVYNLETTTRNMSEFSRQLRDNQAVIISGKPPANVGKKHR